LEVARGELAQVLATLMRVQIVVVVPEAALSAGAAGSLGGVDGLVADPRVVVPSEFDLARIDVLLNERGLVRAGELATSGALEVAEHLECHARFGAPEEILAARGALFEDYRARRAR